MLLPPVGPAVGASGVRLAGGSLAAAVGAGGAAGVAAPGSVAPRSHEARAAAARHKTAAKRHLRNVHIWFRVSLITMTSSSQASDRLPCAAITPSGACVLLAP